MTSPNGAHVADVHVDVHPDASRFKQELKRQLDNQGAVKVLVEPDVDRAEFAKKMRDRLAGVSIGIKVTPDTAGFRNALDRELKGLPAVKIDVDNKAALASVAAVGKAIKALPTSVNLDVDTTKAKASIAGVATALKGLAGTSVRISVDNKAALAAVASVQSALSKLSSTTVRISVNNTAALAAIARVDAAASKLSGKAVTIKVNVDSTAALSALAAIDRAASRLDGRNVRIQIDTTGGAAVLASLATIQTTASGLSGFRVRIHVEVTGNIAALAALAAVAAAARALGAMNPTVNVNTSGISNLLGATSSARGGIQALIAAGIAIGPAIVPAAAAAAAAIGAIGPAAFAAAAGIGVAFLAFKGVGEAVGALGDSQSKAAKTGAQYAQQQAQIASAQDQVRNAHRGVQEAERNLANAQRDALRAQQDINRARQEAKEALEDLDSAVKNNALSIRQAKLDVADAEKELQAVQNLPADNRQRVEAQLRYDQAAQALDDLTTRQGRLAKEQQEAAKKGVEGSDQVKAAQERAADAQERVRDAAVAVQRAQEQVVAATRNLQTTMQTTSASGGAAMDTLREKMEALSPAGQAFARFLHGLRDEFKLLKGAAEAGLFPGLQRGIEAMLPILPQMVTFVSRVATAMGNLFEAAGKALASPFWQNFFDYMGQVAAPLMQALGGVIGGLARGFASLLIAFTPFSIQFTQGMARMAQSFADWAAGLANSDGFNNFINYVKTEGPKVLKLLGEFVLAFIKLGIALAPLGTLVVEGLIVLFEWIADANPGVLIAIAAAIGAITIAFVGLGGPIIAVVASLTAIAGAAAYAYAKFEPFRNAVDKFWTTARDVGIVVFNALKAAVVTFVDAFKRGGDEVSQGGFLGVIERIGLNARAVFDYLKAGVESFVAAFKKGGDEVQQGGFTAYMANLGMVARNVFDWLKTTGIPALQDFATWVGPKLGDAAKIAWTVLETFFAVLNKVFGFIWANRDTIAAVFTAIGTVIKTVFAAAAAIITTWWNYWVEPIFKRVAWTIENILGPVFTWLYENVVRPVWNNIKIGIDIAWAAIQITFGLIQLGIKALAAVFTWLYENMIRPIWNAVAALISAVWEQRIKPIFDIFANFIGQHVAPKFSSAVEGLKSIWGGLSEAARKPVKFIVDTVLNDGLLAAYNWLADKFNLTPKNVRINVPGLSAAAPVTSGGGGGGTPRFMARGGPVWGAGTATSDSIPAMLSNGEYVIPARVVKAIGVNFFDQLIGRKKLPYDTHGELKYADGGLVAWAKSAWDTVTNPIGVLTEKANGLLNAVPGAGEMRQLVVGVGKHTVGGIINYAKNAIAALFSGGDASGIPGNAAPGFPPWPSSPSASRGDSGVWRSIVALIKSTGPVSGSFGNAYRHGDPLWHGCVPMDTKIFTRRGWISRDDIRIGEDETIGYNPLTGKNEWTRIVDVVEYDDAELWTLQNSWVKLEVTPGHKWLVDQQVTVQTETECTECGRDFPTGRGMTKHRADVHGVLTPRRERYEEMLVQTQEFKQSTRVHLAKPANLGDELPITDAEAELIGWIMADGYIEQYGPTIVQSKPEQVEYLKKFMAQFPHSVYVRQPEGRQTHVIYRFGLAWDYWTDLEARAKPAKARAVEFVTELSPTQRAAWLRGFLMADGTRDPRTADPRLGYVAFQVSGPVAEAVKMAAYLEGYRPDTRVKTSFDKDHFGSQPVEHIGLRAPIVKSRHLKRVEVRRTKVWCPTTTLGTWTARQGEEIFLTGNSGRAVDWMGYNQDALAQFFMARQSQLLEFIHRTGSRDYAVTRGRNRGSFSQRLMNEHRNHIHVAMAGGGYVEVPKLYRDNGGFIPPGLSLVDNRTGRDEWMFNDQQVRELVGTRTDRGGGAREMVHIDTFNAYANQSAHDIARDLDWKLRHGG